MTAQDRREFVRRPVDIPVKLSVQGRFYDGLIKNISKGGVFIEAKGTFSVGQKISFCFGKETIIGTVIWVDPKGFGVKFGKP